ncbi:MAG: DUF11 domain-containing protein [Bacilli bacterium]|nr:DUF11 domain-containing protein [Bacilli bacterium]
MKRLLSSIFVLLMLFLVVGCDNHNNQVVYYNVTVNLMDDVDDPTILMQKVLSGNKAVEPEVPLIPHMKCLGFYDGDTLWDFENDLVTKDLELIAKWEEGIQDYEEAEELIAAIDTKDFESIKLARNKYDSLADDVKKYVSNYRNLYRAEIEYYNVEVEKADTVERLYEIIDLIKDYPSDTLLRMGKNVQIPFNKLFELYYGEKISNANDDQQNVIKAIANAFLYKGVYNQYDQTRRVAGSSPYDASIYDTLYLDCSAYIYSVYTYAFGTSHHLQLNTAMNDNYASSHIGTSEIVYYVDVRDYPDEKSQKALLSEIYSNLQVGDCINYRHGTSSGTAGHIVMYIGNDTIIHSTGDDMSANEYSSNPELFQEMQTNKEKVDGTVFTFSAQDMFVNDSSHRYLFKKTASDSVWTFAIIRPLANSTKMKITDKALSNYLLSDVDIYKTSSAGSRTSVKRGQEVTFTLTFVNHSNVDIENVPVYKDLGNNSYDFISTSDNGIYIENAGVFHLINIKANETKEITYTVRVKETASGTISEGDTYVHNIVIPKITNTVCTDFDHKEFTRIATELLNTKQYNSTLELIEDSYKQMGIEIGDLFDLSLEDEAFINGIDYRVSDLRKGTKVKRLQQNTIEIGDILCTYNQKTGEYTNYLYIREDLLVKIVDGRVSKTSVPSGVQFILDKFFAFSKWEVMRPTIIKK